MAKTLSKAYQIVIQNAEDQAFIKRLLEVYGYQEGEPGIFSEQPTDKPTLKKVVSKSNAAAPTKRTISATTSKKNTAVKGQQKP